MVDKCDICGKKTDFLVDYFAMLCQDCKRKYGNLDMNILNLIGSLRRKIEDLEEEKKEKWEE